MKKFIIFITAGFLMTANLAFSQAIDDRTVIPVSVTLNSILRLNVTSGGNIEFNFNTLNDFQTGINAGGLSAAYQTRFTVASSVNWDVLMYAEDASLIGTDLAAGTRILPLNNIGYSVESIGTEPITGFATTAAHPTVQPLTNAPTTELIGFLAGTPNAGDIARNSFIINWRAGTMEPGMNTASILAQGVAADRYSTNVFLVLQPAN